jgi:rsbT co-antagonist protein RsbR
VLREQGLLGVVQAARLLGAEVVLVGVRPEVAQAIVTLGLTFSDLRTYSDLQSALHRLNTTAYHHEN